MNGERLASGNPLARPQSRVSLPGLVILFYTKLLFSSEENDAYIPDQWTEESVVVLFPEVGIRLIAAGLPNPKTLPAVYNAFCAILEACC